MGLTALFQDPLAFLLWVVAVFYAITVHEFAHALSAVLLGDRTPEEEGRLTLNPLAHVDPIGLLLLITVGFGWGVPVRFDVRQVRFPRWGPALIGLAGPFANLLSVVLFASVIRWFDHSSAGSNPLMTLLSFVMVLNLNLMLFNLLPIPPLDGSHLLLSLLPPNTSQWRWTFIQQGPMLLIALILADAFLNGALFRWLFNDVAQWMFALLL